MLLIAGLGNPGGKYAANRHNIGFMAADDIVRRHSFGPWKTKHRAEISDGTFDGEKVLVIKPQTFMNESGQAIGEILRFYKEDLSNLIVIYDELDLAPGKLRIKTGGGAGGHNGIKSIDAHCGKDYRRMRLGIGHPGHKDRVSSYVLGDFAKADQGWLEPLLNSIAENAPLLANGKDANFMNKVAMDTGQNADNGKPKPTKK
ncbi:MAG: aminoacyl-tRNA hydrolase, partial [Pseudomonadota bacterium]